MGPRKVPTAEVIPDRSIVSAETLKAMDFPLQATSGWQGSMEFMPMAKTHPRDQVYNIDAKTHSYR